MVRAESSRGTRFDMSGETQKYFHTFLQKTYCLSFNDFKANVLINMNNQNHQLLDTGQFLQPVRSVTDHA